MKKLILLLFIITCTSCTSQKNLKYEVVSDFIHDGVNSSIITKLTKGEIDDSIPILVKTNRRKLNYNNNLSNITLNNIQATWYKKSIADRFTESELKYLNNEYSRLSDSLNWNSKKLESLAVNI